MDVIANNPANVSTNGFKRQRAVFEDLLYQTIRQPGAQSSEQTTLPSGLQIGTGVRPVATERLHSRATCLRPTTAKTSPLKAGFLPVQLPDGTSAYTRDGSFQSIRTASWSRPVVSGSACYHDPGECPEHHHRA